MDEPTAEAEDRIRLAWAWIRAHVADDGEAIEVLSRSADFEELAGELGAIGAVLVQNLAPAGYLEQTFAAITQHFGEHP